MGVSQAMHVEALSRVLGYAKQHCRHMACLDGGRDNRHARRYEGDRTIFQVGTMPRANTISLRKFLQVSNTSDGTESAGSGVAQQGLSALESLAKFRVGLLVLSFALFADLALLLTGRPNLLHYDPPNDAVPLGMLIVFIAAYGVVMSLGIGFARKMIDELIWACRLPSWADQLLFWQKDLPIERSDERRWLGGYVALREARSLALTDRDTFWAPRIDEADRDLKRGSEEKEKMAHYAFACAVFLIVDMSIHADSMSRAFGRYLQVSLDAESTVVLLCMFILIGVLASPWWLLFFKEDRTPTIEHPQLAQTLLERARERRGHLYRTPPHRRPAD